MKLLRTVQTVLACASIVAVLSPVLSGCSKKVPEAGSKCAKEGDVVCKDKKNALLCAGGTWQGTACRSITGCMSMGTASDSCNNDNKFELGEPCVATDPHCKADGKGVMECKNNKWALVQKCAGMLGCVVNAEGWKCDMSTGDLDDPCMATSKDTYACSVDKKSMLRCDGTKMVAHATCPGLNGCRKQGDSIECNGQKPVK
jgi:hypothetical protein